MARTVLAAIAAVCSFAVALGILVGGVRMDVNVAMLLLVGTTTGMAAVWSVVTRRGTQLRFDLPRPEFGRAVSTPGDDLRDAIGEFHDWTSTTSRPGERTVSGLYGLTVAVLIRFRGLSESEATAQLEDGSWTDDPFAAGLLSPTLTVPDPEIGLRKRLRELASAVPFARIRNRLVRAIESESAYATAIKRTATAVSRVSYDARGAAAPGSPSDRIEGDEETVPARTTDRSVDEIVEERRHQTGYWNGIGVVALLAVTAGLYAREPAVVLIGVVGTAFAGAAALTTAPRPSLSVSRTRSPERPQPGDTVTVTVSITNESDSALLDLRYVDGVPPGLSVVDGSPRIGTALGAGESTTVEYAVEAVRGRHEYDPGLAVTRDLFQSEERAFFVPAASAIDVDLPSTELSDAPILRPLAGTFGSSFATDDSGEGTAFHSVRDYRRGDPLNRIDWNRRARTGDLATLEFQTEYAGSVLLLVDARRAAYVAPRRGAPHAVDRAVTACSAIVPTLLSAGNHVGIGAIGPTARAEEGAMSESCWISPGAGRSHERAILDALSDHPQLSTTVPLGGVQWMSQLRDVRRRLSADTQVLFVTPLTDDVSVEIPRRLEASGHAVTVLSPDATATETTSHRLARIARLIRRFDLQRAGIPVLDWPADEPIGRAMVGGSGTAPAPANRSNGGDDDATDSASSAARSSAATAAPGGAAGEPDGDRP